MCASLVDECWGIVGRVWVREGEVDEGLVGACVWVSSLVLSRGYRAHTKRELLLDVIELWRVHGRGGKRLVGIKQRV